jgi:hypothetical protein
MHAIYTTASRKTSGSIALGRGQDVTDNIVNEQHTVTVTVKDMCFQVKVTSNWKTKES